MKMIKVVLLMSLIGVLVVSVESAGDDTDDNYQTSETLPQVHSDFAHYRGNRNLAQERRCTFGKLEYEKTTGYELFRAKPYTYRLFDMREGGSTSTCTSRCQADSRCQGFNMDYNRNECYRVFQNSQENLFNLRPSTGVAFFEAICLRGRTCGSVWTFERYIDYELRGFIRDTHRDISKTECEDLCLSENRFSCKSASYDHLRKECHLSEEDRFTRPEGFVVKQGSDYLENQCESRQTRCEYTPQTRDQYLIYTDKSLEAFSDASCRQSCTQERDFNCRSYSFLDETHLGTPQCLLSGDTAQSAGGNAFQIATGSLYAEKDCGRQPRPTGDRDTTRSPLSLQQSNNRPFVDKQPQVQVDVN